MCNATPSRPGRSLKIFRLTLLFPSSLEIYSILRHSSRALLWAPSIKQKCFLLEGLHRLIFIDLTVSEPLSVVVFICFSLSLSLSLELLYTRLFPKTRAFLIRWRRWCCKARPKGRNVVIGDLRFKSLALDSIDARYQRAGQDESLPCWSGH